MTIGKARFGEFGNLKLEISSTMMLSWWVFIGQRMKINRLLRASYPQREFQMPTGSISVKWLLAFHILYMQEFRMPLEQMHLRNLEEARRLESCDFSEYKFSKFQQILLIAWAWTPSNKENLPGEGTVIFWKYVQYWGSSFWIMMRLDVDRSLLSFTHRSLITWYPYSKISLPFPRKTTFKSFKALSWVSWETPMVFLSTYLETLSNSVSSLIKAHLQEMWHHLGRMLLFWWKRMKK